MIFLQVQDSEIYRVEELAEDLTDCQVGQVTLLVDQSFSTPILHALRHSARHHNVISYVSGKTSDRDSNNGELTSHWATANHTHACSADVHSVSTLDILI